MHYLSSHSNDIWEAKVQYYDDNFIFITKHMENELGAIKVFKFTGFTCSAQQGSAVDKVLH